MSDYNPNVNSVINRRVSLFYRYPLEVSHHMVCPCTLDGACVVCPDTGELVGQQCQSASEADCELLPLVWASTTGNKLVSEDSVFVDHTIKETMHVLYCKTL